MIKSLLHILGLNPSKVLGGLRGVGVYNAARTVSISVYYFDKYKVQSGICQTGIDKVESTEIIKGAKSNLVTRSSQLNKYLSLKSTLNFL